MKTCSNYQTIPHRHGTNIDHHRFSLQALNANLRTALSTPTNSDSHTPAIYDETRPLATWSASKDFPHAWSMYARGWDYGKKLGLEIARRLRPELHKLHGQLASTLRDTPSLVPGRLDLAAALLDTRPEHFTTTRRSNTSSAGQQEFCSVYMNICYNFGTDIKRMVNFAITIAEVMNMLESLGLVRFRVVPVYACYASSRLQLLEFELKDYLQPINRTQLVTFLAAPFILRRFMFSILDGVRSCDSINENGRGSYGSCIYDTKVISNALKEHKSAATNVVWNLEDCGSYKSILDLLEPLKASLPHLHRVMNHARLSDIPLDFSLFDPAIEASAQN